MQMIQAMDHLVSLSCTISDCFILLSALVTGNFTYILYKNNSHVLCCWSLYIRVTVIQVTNYIHKIFLDSQCKDGYPGSCGKFEKCKKKYTFPLSLLYILNFGRCKLLFSPKALHVRVTVLVMVVPSYFKQIKMSKRMFPLCFQNMPWLFPVM